MDLTGKTVVALDAHGILYQVFHTMREMSGPKGQPTGAAYGFIRDVMNILVRFEPDYVFCAFDMPGKTFRHDLYPAYKANRAEMPEDLKPQMIFVRQLIDALCVKRLEKVGYEADDLLATIAFETEKQGGKGILVTADKDARQLITENISLYNLRKELLYTAEELQADWGIRPDQVVDFQTLVGDATDNVPGVPLVGPKGASQLLQEYGSLDAIYKHLDRLKGKKKENLTSFASQIPITRELVRLRPDVPIDLDWDAGRFQGIDPDQLAALFKELGFRSLLPKIKPLADKFGTRVSTIDESLVGLIDLSGFIKKNDPPQANSLFDDEDEESEPNQNDDNSGPSKATFEEENQPITDALFNALRKEKTSETVIFPETDAFEIPEFHFDQITTELIDTPEKFETLLAKLKGQPVISIDLETVDCEGVPKARPRFAQIAGIALCFDASHAYYLALRGPEGSPLLDEKAALDALRPILESSDVKKIGQNIKFDLIVFRNAGIRVQGVLFDTMVADYLLHSGEQRHNLDELAENYLGHQTIKISELIGTGKSQKLMNEVPTELAAKYAGEDAAIPWFLYPRLLRLLREEPALLRLMTTLEIPLIDVLVEMEANGIAIDLPHFLNLTDVFQEKLRTLEAEIRELAADADPDPAFAAAFNINSTQQLQRILFDDLKLPIIKKTKTGRSTDIEVLEELALLNPLPAKIIEHRQASKLKGTYIDPIPSLRHPVTGRIHASFNQVVTATGRLSSSDPNLQNIPVRSEEGKLIRRGFVPDRALGFDTLLSCDYSQIELRVLTHFSKDKNLTRAFEENIDIHAHVASEIFGVPLDEVTSEMRRKAKAVNFGLIYGQSAFGLGKALGIPQSEAGEYIRKFFGTYPGIHRFLDRVLEECQQNGYVQTILGRKRQIEGVRGARGDKPLNMAERTAINTVIQGSAADLMKAAMVNVRLRLAEINGSEEIVPLFGGAFAQPAVPLPKIASQVKEMEKPSPGFLFDMDETPQESEKIVPTPTLADSAFFKTASSAQARLLLQIHDELLLETRADFAPELARIITQEMELGQPLSVPLKIDAEYGPSWNF